MKVKVLVAQSCQNLFDPVGVAHQAPLSTGFSRQEYWSGLPFPSLGYIPDPGIEPASPAWQVDSLLLKHLENPPGNSPAMKIPAVALELPILNNEVFLVTNYPEVIADSFFPSWKM